MPRLELARDLEENRGEHENRGQRKDARDAVGQEVLRQGEQHAQSQRERDLRVHPYAHEALRREERAPLELSRRVKQQIANGGLVAGHDGRRHELDHVAHAQYARRDVA